ncbi:MAG: hydrogenase iron-sulfur subunit [Anaerolineae bacterium]|nr:hydrogenase iron-sulfur subunit [Anaerolineae bacterium]
MKEPEPKIVVFHCNWAGRRALEALGRARKPLPGGALPVQVSCLGRVHPGLVLKALERGAHGVLLLGCPEAECRFGADAARVARWHEEARSLAALLGVPPEGVRVLRVAPEDAGQVLQTLVEMVTSCRAEGAPAAVAREVGGG